MSKSNAEKEFYIERTILLNSVSKSLDSILLSEDRISKHPPWTWQNEPQDTHLLKAARHIMTHLNIQAGGQSASGKNHLNNAITRLAMALAQEN